jgi:two-component system KDP operon response regulator KdpE
MGGKEACRAIRSGWGVPIIVVSVLNGDSDTIEALDAGADDYVCKPFSFDVLLARVRAALRRSGFATDTECRKISVPGLEVDFEQRVVVAQGVPARLTPTEFELLRYMANNANKPLGHRTLLEAVWGPDYGEEVAYLRVFINQLRKKIEPYSFRPAFIVTEPRIGYRFVLPELSAN